LSELFLQIIEDWGYIGIFILMTLESTVVPIPSEIVMIPAGYLSQSGHLNPYLSVLAGAVGSLSGATINYTISRRYGRKFLWENGKYFLLPRRRLAQMDYFFRKHGEISTFIGRLIPVVRHYISIPAGIAKMRFRKFATFTLLGASFWMVVLVGLGYVIGNNMEEIKHYTHIFGLFILVVAILIFIVIRKIDKRY
jgi:membrane protein DedA with SNARE-associated domain